MAKITFNNKNSAFYDSLKADVNAWFEKNQISKTGNFRLYFKTFFFVGMAITLYFTLLFVDLPPALALTLCGMMGLTLAGIGFNVMHDACHGAYSSKKWVNNLMSLSMNAIGSNAFIWKQKHNVIHHTYTNIDGVDDDIAKSPTLRHCPSQPYTAAHRYQHIYMFPLYAISTMFWAFFTDFQKYFTKQIYTTKMNQMDLKEHVLFWVSKIYYFAVYMIIPAYVVGPIHWLCGFLVMHATFGLTLSIVFQLAHVVEITDFEDVKGLESKKLDDWATHQVLTTSDFAPNSKLISWYVGGLNFQVVHHLFPRISHVHYPMIQPIVESNCKKYGVRYNCIPTMGEAIASHYRTMRALGRG